MTQSKDNGRVWFMDSLRSVLMMLGIILHSGRVYDSTQSWWVRDGAGVGGSDLLTFVGYFIHLFRMQAFYIISGFFCAMTLLKWGRDRFIRDRLLKIGLPVISAALLINFPQFIFIKKAIHNDTQPLGSLFAEFVSQGNWVYHLWFLNYLLIYFIVAWLMQVIMDSWSGPSMRFRYGERLGLCRFNPPLLYVLVPAAAIAIHGMLWFAGLRYIAVLGVINLNDLLFYGVFFVIGILLYKDRQYLERFSRAGPLLVFFLVGLVAADYMFFQRLDSKVGTVIQISVRAILALGVSQMLFAFFNRYLNNPSRLFVYLSTASYSLYLLHHALVIVFGYYLLEFWQGPIWLKYPVLVVTTLIVCLAFHNLLVTRFNVLSLMFNGRRLPATR